MANGTVALAVLLFTACFGCWCASAVHYGGVYFGRVHVYVNNFLAPNKIMDINCRSKDNNLGWQRLAYQQNQTWSFKVNFWGTTLFWCTMVWHDGNGREILGKFDIYDYGRDANKCDGICVWNAQQDGVYFLNPDESDPPERMFTWH